MKPVRLHRRAKKEMLEQAKRYHAIETTLGDEFLDEVNATFERISKFPESGTLLEDSDTRKKVVPRFPFVVYYQIRDEYTWVLTVTHTSRRPGHWKKRK